MFFRKNKKENKAKLEHKLYLARENPEPIFDLSDCGLKNVPSGIYSLCHVFLKEALLLDQNHLSSLAGGGNIKDLCLLKVLNLQDNNFESVPNEIEFLSNLTELYLNDNHIKKLPASLCKLKKLRILDVSNNLLKALPEDIGNLVNLYKLNILGNSSIHHLPKGICYAQRLKEIQVNPTGFIYPPEAVVEMGTEIIMKYVCDDNGFTYVSPESIEESCEPVETKVDSYRDTFQEQKQQEFLEIERNNELLQRQEFALATNMKTNREKLLSDISAQQSKLDSKLVKIHQIKETEKFKLIEQLMEVEQNADLAINQLLNMNREPLAQLIEKEKQEEERLLAAAKKYNETLRKTDVLNAMEELLEQETNKFHKYDESRSEIARSILQREAQSDSHLSDILQNYGNQKVELICKLQEDVELQKVMVGALLERNDARSWSLVQQVRLVESQLAALTVIELDRKRLQMDEYLSDLEEKRANLSVLLMDLLEQQEERRLQLLSTLKTMEEENTMEDFWLRQYQNLLERMPLSITEAQKNIDPSLSQALLMSGAFHCLPFLARLTQKNENITNLTEDDLRDAGVTNTQDRIKILDAFRLYSKDRSEQIVHTNPTAPPLEEATAPLAEQNVHSSSSQNKCVVCMEFDCEVIFVPCGHLCCCMNCADPLLDCPMCRGDIERKIRIYTT